MTIEQSRRQQPRIWGSGKGSVLELQPGYAETLFRPLIFRLRSEDGQRRQVIANDNVLLDVEVDGVRCLLIERRAQGSPTVLSPREREIARMIADGYPSKTIAAALDISCWTVSTHVRRIFAKLGVHSRAAMVARLGEGTLRPERTAPREASSVPP